MNNHLKKLVEGWFGKQLGTVKLFCVRRKGETSPTGKFRISSGLKRLDMWVIHLLAHNSFAVLSGAGHRNNFCNGALVDSHKMKAALKVQFTFPLGLLNEILTGVETEESPTHEVGAAVSFTTTDCYCQFNELKALRFQSNCKRVGNMRWLASYGKLLHY